MRTIVKIIAPILASIPLILLSFMYSTYLVLILSVEIILLSCAISLEVVEESLIYAQSLIYISLAYIFTFLLISRQYPVLASLWIIASAFFAPLLARSRRRESIYSCVKYVTFSAIGSTILIIGISMMLMPSLRTIGLMLLVLGVLYETGVVPLHVWLPDVYRKSDRESVAMLSSLMKIIAALVLSRLFISMSVDASYMTFLIFAILSTITMIIGNLGALFADNVEHLLAFSSIAQTGYALAVLSIGFLNNSLMPLCLGVLILQFLSVAISKCALFIGLDSDGRGVKPMVLINALSLIGIPPLVGFWPKLFIVWYALETGQVWLAIIIIINSAISVPYYIRLLRIYKVSRTSNILTALMIILTVLVIILGVVFPLEILRECVGILQI
ncbi:MAG: hypothetical protein GXO10_04690 [Crenarchaeota archaeon]|nr:hypothetical protein [Thermoproteota archaeon]